MGVQTLRPELAVEGLDEAVIGGFAGPREVQNDIVGIGPEIEIPGDELTAVVDPERDILKIGRHYRAIGPSDNGDAFFAKETSR